MFCNNCGKPLTEGAAFCEACGAPVEVTPEAPKKKKKKGLLIGIIAGVTAAAVAIAAVAGWFLFARKETVYVLVRAESSTSICTYEYDDHGRLLRKEMDHGEESEVWDEELKYYTYTVGAPDGTIDFISEYEYDEHGNTTYYLWHRPESQRKDQMDFDWEYDGDLPETCDNSDEGTYYFTHKDNLLTEIHWKNKGKKIRTRKVSYDDDGHVTKIVQAPDSDSPTTYTYTYNSKGQVTKADIRDWRTIKYTYDSKGNLTKVTRTTYGDKDYLAEYEYDGNRILSKSIQTNTRDITIDFQYDRKRLEQANISNTHYEEDEYGETTSTTTSATLFYDENENLIRVEKDGETTCEFTYEKMRLSKADATRYQLTEIQQGFWGNTDAWVIVSSGTWEQQLQLLCNEPLSPEKLNDPPLY